MTKWFRLHPHLATEKGQPGLDHLTPDYRHSTIETFLAELADLKSKLAKIKVRSLNPEQELHFHLLGSQLEAVQHPFRYRNVLTQNPVFYLQAGLDGLESLRYRYRKPPWDLIESRLKGLSPLLKVAREQLIDPRSPALEIACEMAEDAIEELAPSIVGSNTPKTVLRAVEGALLALKEFHRWLGQQPQRDFVAMGPDAFSLLLQTEHHLDRPWSVWETMATSALENTEILLRAEPVTTLELGVPPSRAEVWDYYGRELERVEGFLEKAQIVTIPAGELLLCQTPAYLESLIPGPFYLEPALYSGARVGRFYLPSLPREWTSEVAGHYARRLARGAFTNLVVHEAWPGHHLQFLHAAEHHHPLRNLRDNDVMLEGWALYCEELMEEVGLHETTPFVPRLNSLKFRTVRVLLDIGLHTGKLSLSQAGRVMSQHFPQASKSWITAEVRRYALEPGQALSYWVGAQLIKELKTELGIERERYREFHDALLSFGAIPLPLIAERLRSVLK